MRRVRLSPRSTKLARLCVTAIALFFLIVIMWAPWGLTLPQSFVLRSSNNPTNKFALDVASLIQERALEGIQSFWLVNGILHAPRGRHELVRSWSVGWAIPISDQSIKISPLRDPNATERLIRFHPEAIYNFYTKSARIIGKVTVSWFEGREPPVPGKDVEPGFTLVITLRTRDPVEFQVLSGKADIFVEGVQVSADSKALAEVREGSRIVSNPASLEEPYTIETLPGEDTTIHLQFVPTKGLSQIRMVGKATRIQAELAAGSMVLRDEDRLELDDAKVTIQPDRAEFSFGASREGLSVSAEGTGRGIWRSGRRLTLSIAAWSAQRLGAVETLLAIAVALLTPEILGRIRKLYNWISARQ